MLTTSLFYSWVIVLAEEKWPAHQPRRHPARARRGESISVFCFIYDNIAERAIAAGKQ